MAQVHAAAVQTDPRLRDKAGNLERMEAWIHRAAQQGAQLVVFPECALSGYGYASEADAREDAEAIPGPSTDRIAEIAAATDAVVAFGMIEAEGADLYNAAALVGPGGLIGRYRKTHLPYEAVDRFVSPGRDPFEVFDTPVGRVGLLICFDLRFPEPARILALQGAEVIANLTNLPPPGRPQADFIFQTRAAENRVWLICADRVGTEGSATYIGRSAIVSHTGELLATAGETDEELLVAAIEPELAREKDIIVRPGEYELHLFGTRRPELYEALVSTADRYSPEPA